jgi:hypothetical protein
MESDDRRRFASRLADADDALRWVRSLYLPGVSPRRIRAQRLTSPVGRLEHRHTAPRGRRSHTVCVGLRVLRAPDVVIDDACVFSDRLAGRLDVDAAEASGRLRPDGDPHDADIFAMLCYPYPAAWACSPGNA